MLNQKLTMLAKERIENRHEFDSLIAKKSLLKTFYKELNEAKSGKNTEMVTDVP